MGKLLRVKDFVLISAAFVGDFVNETRNVGGVIPALMKSRYGFVPSSYKKVSYVSAISKMLKTEEIEKRTGKDGKVYIILTSKGHKSFERKFPLLSLKRSKWDGYFMTVIFDIPEKERFSRDILRKKLQNLGFGMLQESVWISPYHFETDLREFLVTSGLLNKAIVMESRDIFSENTSTTYEKVWKIENIKNKYEKIIVETEIVKDLTGSDKENSIKNIWEMYFETLKIDPILPDELSNISSLRKKALKAIENIAG